MTLILELDSATEERIIHAADQAGVSVTDYVLQMIGAQSSKRPLASDEWLAQIKKFGDDAPLAPTLPLEATRREAIYED